MGVNECENIEKLEDELPFSISCSAIFPEQWALSFNLFGSKAAPIEYNGDKEHYRVEPNTALLPFIM